MKEEIEKLKKAINSPATPEFAKPKLQARLDFLEEKYGSEKKEEKKPEKVKKEKTASKKKPAKAAAPKKAEKKTPKAKEEPKKAAKKIKRTKKSEPKKVAKKVKRTKSKPKAAPKKIKKGNTYSVKYLNGSSKTEVDKKESALKPGKRISKGGVKNQFGVSKKGNVYYEYRANHADLNAKKKLEKGGEVDDIKVGDMFYSYENPDEPRNVTYISGEGENKKYKLSLRDKEGYSYSSKYISKGSLSKTSRKSDAKKVKSGKMTRDEFREKWGSEMYIDKY